jgi:hypothetical protein
MREMRILAARGVIVNDETWESPSMKVRLTAPPTVIGRESSPEQRSAAQAVLDAGLASSSPTGRGKGSFAIELVTAHPLPNGVLASAAMICFQMARSHPVVAVLVTVAPLVMQIAGFTLIAWAGACALIVAASFVVHEVGHATAHRIFAGTRSPLTLRCTSISADLVWRSTGAVGRDMAIVVAGPAAPLILTGPLVVATHGNIVVIIAALIVAVSHIASLGIRAGDGDTLRMLMLAGRSTKEQQ